MSSRPFQSYEQVLADSDADVLAYVRAVLRDHEGCDPGCALAELMQFHESRHRGLQGGGASNFRVPLALAEAARFFRRGNYKEGFGAITRLPSSEVGTALRDAFVSAGITVLRYFDPEGKAAIARRELFRVLIDCHDRSLLRRRAVSWGLEPTDSELGEIWVAEMAGIREEKPSITAMLHLVEIGWHPPAAMRERAIEAIRAAKEGTGSPSSEADFLRSILALTSSGEARGQPVKLGL